MSLPQQLQAERVERTLQDLKKNRAWVRIRVDGTGFEKVSLVTDVRTIQKDLYFKLDDSPSLLALVEPLETWKINIEFIATGQVPFLFESTSGLSLGGGFWLKAPDRIDRIQRRRDFRLKAPMGARLEVTRHRKPITLGLIDLSLGGLLGLVDSVNPRLRKEPIFKVGRTFKNARLVVPIEESPDMVVSISKVRVVRSFRHPVTGAFQYGLMFIALDAAEEKSLKDLLYGLQRSYLRKRRTLAIKP
ncbi:MAG: PilZ domain-containing protein [Desulfobacterales bacterium]